MCQRHTGIGADGLIEIKNHSQALFRMVYYNADGFEGTMCGNGGRCVAAYAFNQGWASDILSFLAQDGLHQAKMITPDNPAIIRLKMKDIKTIKTIDQDFFMDTGSPHYITYRENLEALDVIKEGRSIRKSYRKEGTNVNFIRKKDNRTLQIRTYERGVENETLACGTGVTAAAAVYAAEHNCFGEWITIEAKGGTLRVIMNQQNNTFTDIWLEGPAKFVFEGTTEI
jgi:diaminopimelate epimerase